MQQKKLKKRLLSNQDIMVGILYFFSVEGAQVLYYDSIEDILYLLGQYRMTERYGRIFHHSFGKDQKIELAWNDLVKSDLVEGFAGGYLISSHLESAYEEDVQKNVYRYKRKLLKEIAFELKDVVLEPRQQSAA